MQNLTLVFNACLLLALTSCGGGGSSNPQPTNPTVVVPPPPPPEPEPESDIGGGFTQVFDTGLSVTVGYLQPAQVNQDPAGSLVQHPEQFAGGMAAGDYDNDGDLDLFIVRGDIGGNLLFQNNGQGQFVDVANQTGVAFTKSATENYRHSGPAFADIDGDGDLDLFLGGLEGDPALLFANNGDGSFTDVTSGSGIDLMQVKFTISATFADYDKDGDLDMFLSHWGNPIDIENPPNSAHLWRNDSNNGDIKFVDVSQESGITQSILQQLPNSILGNDHDASFTPNFVDFNNDQYPDIFLASDFNSSRVLLNKQDGTFENITQEDEIIDDSGMGAAVADFDNDGDLDWFVSAIFGGLWTTGNRLYENQAGNFVDVSILANINPRNGDTQQQLSWGWGACAMDFNNDTQLDIYLTNGFPYQFENDVTVFDFNLDLSRLFIGNGDNTFLNRAEDFGLADDESSRTVVCADFDKDGDIDIVQLHRNEINALSYYQNDIAIHNSIQVQLKDTTSKNIFAIGAKIYLTIGDLTQMREVTTGNNFTAQNDTIQSFGLGQQDVVDSIKVVWPDGTQYIQNNISANQTLLIEK